MAKTLVTVEYLKIPTKHCNSFKQCRSQNIWHWSFKNETVKRSEKTKNISDGKSHKKTFKGGLFGTEMFLEYN